MFDGRQFQVFWPSLRNILVICKTNHLVSKVYRAFLCFFCQFLFFFVKNGPQNGSNCRLFLTPAHCYLIDTKWPISFMRAIFVFCLSEINSNGYSLLRLTVDEREIGSWLASVLRANVFLAERCEPLEATQNDCGTVSKQSVKMNQYCFTAFCFFK